MDCPRCGQTSPPEARFCGNCAAPLLALVECPGCGFANPGRQRFCNACGHELTEAAREASARAEPRRPPIPDHLAQRVRALRGTLEGERKLVTVLFADVVGSMELAEQRDPEAWRELMDDFFAILCDGVHRFEGTVDKFTGDGIMALFGAPIAHEDHAQRAGYAALYLRQALTEHAAELRRTQGLSFSVRIGINSGEVVVGTIGDDLGMDYTAVGHTVGLAQRMEQLAEPGQAYLTEHTAALVEGYLALEDLGQFQVKGSSQPLRVFSLQGVGTARGRLDISRERGFSRFVGRSDELAVLESALETARSGNSQVVGVVGEAGVGKSRLCDVFIQRCRSRGIPVYHVAAHAHTQNVPLAPVLELMRSYFDVSALDSHQVARERIAGKLLLLDERFADDLPLLFDFLGVPDPERPAPRMDPEARQQRLLKMVRRLVRTQVDKEAGVTVFEDLHWIDPASKVFLANHVEASQGGRGMTLLNFRPEYHADWMSGSNYRQVPLAALGDEAIRALLDDLLGPDPSLDGIAELIGERTAGNPFFIEEVVRDLVESGYLTGERGARRLVRPLELDAVPTAVQPLLAARIDRLGAREKSVLQTAAVIGREFPAPLLAAATGLDEDELDQALHELTSAEFTYEQELYPEAIYAFRHPLTRDVAYGSQLAGQRAERHAAVARALACGPEERLDEQAALIAEHWEQAGERLDAARWHARTATAVGTSDVATPVRHWARVRELVEPLAESDETYSLGLAARFYSLTFGFRVGVGIDAADRAFAEGRRMAEQRGDRHAEALLLSAYGVLLGAVVGDFERYVSHGMRAIELAEEIGDPALYLAVAQGGAYGLFVSARLRECLQVAERAIELAGDDPTLGSGVSFECPLAFALMMKGMALTDLRGIADGLEWIDHSLEVATAQGAVEMLGWIHNAFAYSAELAGEYDAIVSQGRQALEFADRIGSPFSRSWGWFFVGLGLTELEQWQAALDALAQAREIGSSHTGDLSAWALIAHGRALWGAGHLDEGEAMLRDGLELARRRGERSVALGCVHLGARLVERDGARALAEALALLDEADEWVARQELRIRRPYIGEARGRLLAAAGDETGAEHELRAALTLYEELGASGHARRLVDELAQRAAR